MLNFTASTRTLFKPSEKERLENSLKKLSNRKIRNIKLLPNTYDIYRHIALDVVVISEDKVSKLPKCQQQELKIAHIINMYLLHASIYKDVEYTCEKIAAKVAETIKEHATEESTFFKNLHAIIEPYLSKNLEYSNNEMTLL